MADDKDKDKNKDKDGKYDGNGFHQDNDGSVWGDPSVEGGESDFESWDWKQIKAAVVGGAAVPGDQSSRTLAISDPNSFVVAAGAFSVAQQTLTLVAQNLRLQADSLAGKDRPWQGDAANSFNGMMQAFAAQLDARADQIAGGASHTNPVPRQLWNNGQYLAWARDLLQRLDEYYAAYALSQGAPKGDNGLVTVSSQPEIVAALNRDMRSVIRLLARNYEITISELVPVDTSSFNKPPPPKDPPKPKDMPDPPPPKKLPDPPPPKDLPPPPAPPPPPKLPPPPAAPPPPKVPLPGGPPPGGLPGGGPPGGLPGGPPPVNLGALPPPPGGLNGPKGGNLPTPDGLQGLGDKLPDGLKPPGAGELGGLPDFAAGELSPPSLNSPGPQLGGLPAGLPGGLPLGKRGGASGGLPGGKPGGLPSGLDAGLPLSERPGTEVSGLEDALSPVTGGLAGLDQDERRLGTGMPGMPMTPMSPGSQQGGAAERPDAAGLLAGGPEDWAAMAGPGVGDPVGADTPAVTPAEWAADSDVDGTPRMPGMPGMPMAGSPASQNGGGAERPDAAGLLAGDPESWEAVAGPDVGDPVGADTPAVTPAEWAADSEVKGMPQVPGMPMMPMSGSPATQAGGGAERPDAAGLLAGEPESWGAVAGPDVGDPVGADAPAVTSAEWVAQGPASQVVPGVPMMPVPTLPAGSRTRRDSARRPEPEQSEASRVPVVRHTDEEDFSAWDAPSPIFGGVVAQPASGRQAEVAPEPSTTDEVDELPVRYRPGVNRQNPSTRQDDTPVLCGADEAPPVDEDADEDAGDEEEPRTMADLLTLHNSAWSKENKAPSGVLD